MKAIKTDSLMFKNYLVTEYDLIRIFEKFLDVYKNGNNNENAIFHPGFRISENNRSIQGNSLEELVQALNTLNTVPNNISYSFAYSENITFRSDGIKLNFTDDEESFDKKWSELKGSILLIEQCKRRDILHGFVFNLVLAIGVSIGFVFTFLKFLNLVNSYYFNLVSKSSLLSGVISLTSLGISFYLSQVIAKAFPVIEFSFQKELGNSPKIKRGKLKKYIVGIILFLITSIFLPTIVDLIIIPIFQN